MRFRHPDGSVVHVAYGSNVHPAESVEGIIEQARRYSGGVRAALGVPRLGVGLWLPARAAAELASDIEAVERLRLVLRLHGLEVVTVNAFPYRGFHDEVVKRAVYHPSWAEQPRLDYTLDCARVLAMLLPDDAARGSISTLPFGWRTPWFADRDDLAREHLEQLTEGLSKIAAEIGRPVQVGLEPEPGCTIERVSDVVERLSWLDPDYVGVCLDTCHLATEFEHGPTAVAQLEAAGVAVVKVQASAALHAEDPSDPQTRAALESWTEDRFLHQVREERGGRVVGRDDLPLALGGERPLPGQRPWRVHFHVPLHADPEPPLTSTREHLVECLDALVGGGTPVTDHIEIETYTWAVLPEGQRPHDDATLVAGLAAEIDWLREQFAKHGLTPMEASA
jgi:sugar phosphate isomerase/epimerase